VVRVTIQNESRFDSLASAHQPDLLDAASTVLSSKLFCGDARGFDDTRIGHELSRCGRARRVEVRHGLCRCLNGGLTCALSPRAHNDALLSGAKADHGRSRNSESEHDGQNRLAAFIAQGAHSTRRAAAPSMIKRGRPTNPSGTGIA
jgi:hypothetical protein